MAALLDLVLGVPFPPLEELLVPVLILGGFAALICLGLLFGGARSDPTPATMLPAVEAAAVQLGFRPCPPPDATRQCRRFEREGVELVALELLEEDESGAVVRGRVVLRLAYGFRGRPTSLPTRPRGSQGQPSWATPQPTGDRVFDAAFAVRGTRPQTAAVLDSGTRALALGLRARGMTTEEWGTLELDLTNPVEDAVRAAVPDLVALAAKLALDGPSVPAALVRVASEELLPEVRARALGLLQEHFPQEPSTQPVVLEALRSSLPEVALAAAKAVGGEAGREVLLRLAASNLEVAVRSEALVAISGLRDPRVEPTLIRALDARTPQGVVLDAVRALASVGTTAAVGPLREVQARCLPFGPTAKEVRRAVEQIHARVGFAASGALTVADAALLAGSLAAPGTAGQVAVAGDADSPQRS